MRFSGENSLRPSEPFFSFIQAICSWLVRPETTGGGGGFFLDPPPSPRHKSWGGGGRLPSSGKWARAPPSVAQGAPVPPRPFVLFVCAEERPWGPLKTAAQPPSYRPTAVGYRPITTVCLWCATSPPPFFLKLHEVCARDHHPKHVVPLPMQRAFSTGFLCFHNLPELRHDRSPGPPPV